MNHLRKVAIWLDNRIHLTKLWNETAGHPVPASSASWFYVFGSATLICFMIQIVTGAILAFVYVPSANQAWNSLVYLNHAQYMGWYIRAVHEWGSTFMVAIMTAHMIQVFLFGAYKFPRELTWMSGVVLLLLTLGMAFTGQVLRFDQDAYWGLGIGASITGRVPLIGGQLVHVLLAGPIIAGETLSRFFSFHVFIIPGLILALISFHLRLVLAKGINEYPVPGHPVVRRTYEAEYEAMLRRDQTRFVPDAIGNDLIFGALVIIAILACAAIFGPKGPGGPPNPTLVDTNPRPDFYFLSVFAALALLPVWLEVVALFVAPVVLIGFLFALPFLSNTGEKSWRRRPVAVLSVVLIMTVIGVLAYMGETSPWSPHMDAWSADPVPLAFLRGRTPLQMRGALVFQNKQCRNCHSLANTGGKRGPALDDVAMRMTRPELIRQVIQGGGNMPAYGKKLTPAEVDALVSFLQSLLPAGAEAARDSATPPSIPEQ